MNNYLLLILAIFFEIIATSGLKASEGFSRLTPSLISILGYIASFYFLSLTLKSIPIGIAYAVWSGIGIVLISIVGFLVFNQSPDIPALVGISLIMIGVLIIHLFSDSVQP